MTRAPTIRRGRRRFFLKQAAALLSSPSTSEVRDSAVCGPLPYCSLYPHPFPSLAPALLRSDQTVIKALLENDGSAAGIADHAFQTNEVGWVVRSPECLQCNLENAGADPQRLLDHLGCLRPFSPATRCRGLDRCFSLMGSIFLSLRLHNKLHNMVQSARRFLLDSQRAVRVPLGAPNSNRCGTQLRTLGLLRRDARRKRFVAPFCSCFSPGPDRARNGHWLDARKRTF